MSSDASGTRPIAQPGVAVELPLGMSANLTVGAVVCHLDSSLFLLTLTRATPARQYLAFSMYREQ